jgi:hypothetical protein
MLSPLSFLWGSHRPCSIGMFFIFFHVLYLPQARPRADCCTPGICLCIVLATLNFCFAQCSRANGLVFIQVRPRADCCTPATLISTLNTSTSVFHVLPFIGHILLAQSSRANGVGLLVRPRAVCFIPFTLLLWGHMICNLMSFVRSSRASGVVNISLV